MKRRDFLKTATVPILCAPVITDTATSQEQQDCCDRMAPGTWRNYDSLDWDVPPTILDGEYIPQCQALYVEQLKVANVLLHPTVSWEIQEPIMLNKHWHLVDIRILAPRFLTETIPCLNLGRGSWIKSTPKQEYLDVNDQLLLSIGEGLKCPGTKIIAIKNIVSSSRWTGFSIEAAIPRVVFEANKPVPRKP